jgi:hypothetical protein
VEVKTQNDANLLPNVSEKIIFDWLIRHQYTVKKMDELFKCIPMKMENIEFVFLEIDLLVKNGHITDESVKRLLL